MGNFAGIAPEQCPVSALSDTFQLSNEQLEAVFRRARSDSPVVYLEDIDYWAVTRYDDIKAISQNIVGSCHEPEFIHS